MREIEGPFAISDHIGHRHSTHDLGQLQDRFLRGITVKELDFIFDHMFQQEAAGRPIGKKSGKPNHLQTHAPFVTALGELQILEPP